MSDGQRTAGQPGDETGRLLAAVQDWARRTLPSGGHHPGSDCQWCPVCQLRGEHPELLERMAEAGTAITDAVRALAESAVAREPGGARRAQRPRPRPESRVQRITLCYPADRSDLAEPEEQT